MERRLLIVFALTFLVIMLFQPLLKKYGPQPPAKQGSAAETRSAGQPGAAVPTQNPTPSTQASAANGAETPASAPLQAASESETVIENEVYRIVFANRVGRVRSWVVKKYTDDKGGPLELVNTAAAEKYGYPLTLWMYDETLRNKLNSVLYMPTQTQAIGLGEFSAKLSVAAKGLEPASNALAAPAEITFAYDDGDVSVQKSYKFDRDSYVVGVRTSVAVKGAQVTAFPMWPAGFGGDTGGPQYAV